MADYSGNCRSNYFKVKSQDDFINWAESLDLDVWTESHNHPGCVGFGCYGSIPSYRYKEGAEDGNFEEVDFAQELAAHLVDGEVAIYQEVGHEKLRYLSGFSVAVRSDGKVLSSGIDEIFKKVKRYWRKGADEVTDCAY